MEDLIKAFTIFMKYLDNPNDHNPTHCEHDEMWIMGVEREQVSDEDNAALELLGFVWCDFDDSYKSFRFGSA